MMMRILRVVVIISTAVVATACATTSKRLEEPRLRFVGVDGQEIQQVVPMGIAASAPAPAGQIKPGEWVFQQIQASVPMTWNRAVLVIMPRPCEGRSGPPFELALYNPDALERTDAMSIAATSALPTRELYEVVEKLFEAMRELTVSPRFTLFHARRDGNGRMRGEVRYE